MCLDQCLITVSTASPIVIRDRILKQFDGILEVSNVCGILLAEALLRYAILRSLPF